MLEGKIRRYYRLAILMHCGINTIYAMYATYLLSRGLDILQLCLVHAVFYGLLAILELPTGAIADLYGRMTAVSISCVVFILCMLTFAYTDTFWAFMAAAALRAVAQTFASGASDAWIRNALRQNGDSDEKSRDVFFQAEVRKHTWGIGAAGGGAVLVDMFGMTAAWLLGIAFYTAALCVALYSMREENSERKSYTDKRRETMIATVQTGVRYARTNRNICFTMVAAAGFSFAIATPNIIWQPFFAERMPTWLAAYQSSLGFLWALAMFTHLVGIWVASKLGTTSDARRVLLICGFITAVGMVCTAVSGPLGLTLVVYLTHQGARGPYDPWTRTYMHNSITRPETEATVASFVSVIRHVSQAVALVITGLVAKYATMSWSWSVGGIVLLVVVIALWQRRTED